MATLRTVNTIGVYQEMVNQLNEMIERDRVKTLSLQMINLCAIGNSIKPNTFTVEEIDKLSDMIQSKDREMGNLGMYIIQAKLKIMKILSDCCGEVPTECKDGMGVCPSCKEVCECVKYENISEHPELNVSEG